MTDRVRAANVRIERDSSGKRQFAETDYNTEITKRQAAQRSSDHTLTNRAALEKAVVRPARPGELSRLVVVSMTLFRQCG